MRGKRRQYEAELKARVALELKGDKTVNEIAALSRRKRFMRAICLTKYGSIENFATVDLPTPEPKRGQIRVRVHASAVGSADFKVATGLFTFLHGRKFPMTLGSAPPIFSIV